MATYDTLQAVQFLKDISKGWGELGEGVRIDVMVLCKLSARNNRHILYIPLLVGQCAEKDFGAKLGVDTLHVIK